MEFFTIAAISAVCLALPATRIYGIVGIGILIYFYTFLALGVLIAVGVILQLMRHQYRRYFS